MITLTLRGADEFLRKWGADAVLDAVQPGLTKGGYRLQRRTAVYPPPPPRSTYRRTGAYGRGWTVKTTRIPGMVEVTVGNNRIYGPFVGSARFQTRTHRRTGWVTDEMAARAEVSNIVMDVERSIQEAFR